jgi:hypothetical protein
MPPPELEIEGKRHLHHADFSLRGSPKSGRFPGVQDRETAATPLSQMLRDGLVTVLFQFDDSPVNGRFPLSLSVLTTPRKPLSDGGPLLAPFPIRA